MMRTATSATTSADGGNDNPAEIEVIDLTGPEADSDEAPGAKRSKATSKFTGSSNGAKSSKKQRVANHPGALVSRTNDGATVTPGILGLLRGKTLPNGDIRMCGVCYAGGLLPLHYRQPDQWSCGYRNLQMILSALIPLFAEDHPFFSNTSLGIKFSTRSNAESWSPFAYPPTLLKIQNLLEAAWNDGFDPDGRNHYRGKIQNKSKWIGAVEVASILSHLFVDCVVVQFLVRFGNAPRMIGEFVWQYFSQDSGFDACEHCSCRDSDVSEKGNAGARRTVKELTQGMLRNVESIYEQKQSGFAPTDTCVSSRSDCREGAAGTVSTNSSTQCSASPLLPIYLQWEGHSVTIVGIERTAVSYNLLIFDPSKTPNLSSAGSAIATTGGNAAAIPHVMRLEASKLFNKDCQMLICGKRI